MENALKSYEIGYLVRSEEGARILLNHLKRLGAEISFEAGVKGIKLTYPIRHLSSAYFGYNHFEIDPGIIGSLNDSLKLDSEIMRFLIVTPPFLRGDKSSRPSPEPTQPRRTVKPRAETSIPSAASNDLLEEKLEEILNK